MLQRFLTVLVISTGLVSCTLPQVIQKAAQVGDVFEVLIKEDVEAARRYRERRRHAIDDMFDECSDRADEIPETVPWVEAMTSFQNCLDILTANPPILLIERVHEFRLKINPNHAHGD